MNARIKWLRNQLSSLKLDGIIVSNPVNIRYLTGLNVEDSIFIIAPKENTLITDGRYIEYVNRSLTISDEIVACNIKNLSKYDFECMFVMGENIGIEEKFITYETYKTYLQTYQVDLSETEGIIENQRIVKDEEEIECIKKACEITDKAFKYISQNIRKGMTEKQIAFEIEKFMLENGADGRAFDTIVASGRNSAMPHATPTDRKIVHGDIIQLDMGCKYNGYASDMSRVVFVGEIDEEYKKAYDFVLAQQRTMANTLKDGANIKQAVKDRETEYKLKGYEVMHSFGHGVGLLVHEAPALRSQVDCILKENSVITIEPGVYVPNSFGIRIEDTYHVTKNGCVALTNSTKNYLEIRN